MTRMLLIALAAVLLGLALAQPLPAARAGAQGTLNGLLVLGEECPWVVRQCASVPLPYRAVDVLAAHSNKVIARTNTNVFGGFTVKLAPGAYRLRASAPGASRPVLKLIRIRAGRETGLRFSLGRLG